MIVTLDELVKILKPAANPNDTLPSEALWIAFAPSPKPKTNNEKTVNTVDDRTPDGNTLVQIVVDHKGAILDLEIFP